MNGDAARMVREQGGWIYASSCADDRTCIGCRANDGRRYDDLDEAVKDFPPDEQGYAGCLNRRCRCTLVWVSPSEVPFGGDA